MEVGEVLSRVSERNFGGGVGVVVPFVTHAVGAVLLVMLVAVVLLGEVVLTSWSLTVVSACLSLKLLLKIGTESRLSGAVWLLWWLLSW